MVKIPIGINHRYKAGWERNVAMYSQRVEYDNDDNMPDLKINLVEFDYKPTKEYSQAEEGVISIGEYESTMTKLAAVTKLHQIVNGFAYIYNEDDERITYDIERCKKLDWLVENVKDEPTTIVYRFEADKNHIEELFKNKCTESVDEFKQGKYEILLLQCSRCESFNLQMCKHMIFYTLDYSYIKYNQMLHRIWRMGQTDNVNVDVLIHKDTVETKIWNTVQNKEKFADLFMSIKGV
jgi:SNF2 family DNA or RNA helicase